MSYANGESLILAQIRATSTFDSGNSAQAIYTLLNTGKTVYAILRPSNFSQTQSALGSSFGDSRVQYTVEWITRCDLYAKLITYETAIPNLINARDAIISRFHQYRKAADTTNTIEDVSITSGADLIEVDYNGSIFISTNLSIVWRENIYATQQE